MMELIDRAALLRTFDTVQKSDPMADNGRGYDDHFINDAGEPSAEWFCVEDYVLKMPTIPAVPLEPLCEWLAKNACYDQLEDNGMRSRFSLLAEQWKFALAELMEGRHG